MLQMVDLIDRLLLRVRKLAEAVEENEGTLNKEMFLSNSKEMRIGVLWSFGGKKIGGL